MNRKIPNGLIYGFIIGIIISLFYFVPVINIIPLVIGSVIDWLWEILFSSILKYEKIPRHISILAQLSIMVIIFSLIGSSYSSEKKWIKIIGIFFTVIIILAVLARIGIPFLG